MTDSADPGLLRILVVEDVADDAELVVAELRRAGLQVVARRVETEAEFVRALHDFVPDVILSDYVLPSFSGSEALRLALEHAPETPFVICTGSLDEETAVASIKAGAWDYVLKDRLSRLPTAVVGALELARARRERAETLDALRFSEARLRLITDAAPALISYVDKDLRYREVNRSYARWFGVGAEEARGRRVEEVIGTAAFRAVRGWIERALAGERVTFEVEVPYRDAGNRWVSATYTPDRDAAGAVRGFVALVNDVTAQKRAEQALRESEARYRSLFEQSPIGIYRTTPDGRILLANPALLRMIGYDSADELYALNLEDGGFDSAYPRDQFKAILERDGELRGYQAVWTRRDGAKVYVEENALAIRDAAGRVMYYEGTVEDVTARKQAEEAHRLLATAVEQSAEAVVVTDTAGVIQYVNPAFTAVTGWGREEAIGLTPAILKSGRQDAGFYAEMWRTILAGGVWSGRLTNRRKDGTLYQEDTTISPVRDERGTIVRFVAAKRDVTREEALQQQLNHAQRMEAVGRLAGGIAHDFNNLLQALMSHVEVLRRAKADGASGERSFVELDQLVRRGAALTRQLLLFSRQETTLPQELDLGDVVTGAVVLLRRIVRENVVIQLDLADAPLPVVADRGQLDQVLMNLVVNASDAMPEGGTVVLATGGDRDSAWLAVRDSGAGIPEQVRSRLFEPFFTTKPAGKGTGLGLSVVHGIVAAHGGTIEVADGPGGGAVFTVILPRSRSRSAEIVEVLEEHAAAPAGGGEHVLVVEDEEGARQGLAELLTILGYAVTTAASAEEALTLPETMHVDLVLSDLLLPGMNGAELVARLQARWPHLKVVLMSGYTEDEALRQVVATGAVEFLQKPFDMAALAETVRRVLEEAAPDAGR